MGSFVFGIYWNIEPYSLWNIRKKCHLVYIITKTYLYNIEPLQPYFYIVKLGFTGVYIIFLNSVQNIDCRYSLEPPRWGGSNEYLQSMFWTEIRKISEFLSENFQFLEVKFSIYLNRHVFVMSSVLACRIFIVELIFICDGTFNENIHSAVYKLFPAQLHMHLQSTFFFFFFFLLIFVASIWN